MVSSDITTLILVGPTGVGKSSLALRLAERYDGEIINADSQQVYVGMDIGTAKPTIDERARVPHHVLDVVTPDQLFNANDFLQRVSPIIDEIKARGKRPIVVGGTGLYVSALLNGLSELPPRDVAIRAELESLAKEKGTPFLHQMLTGCDPERASQVAPRDTTRVIRSLEVWKQTGKSILSFWNEARSTREDSTCVVGLTMDRAALYERIDRRVETMMAAGWLDECRQLVGRYGIDAPGLRAIGYRELGRFIQEGGDLSHVVAEIQQQTRHYAKRQWTWFRRMPDVVWMEGDDPSIEEMVNARLNG